MSTKIHTLSNAWVLNYGTSFTYVNNHNSQRYNLAAMSGMNKEKAELMNILIIYIPVSKRILVPMESECICFH